MEAREFDINTWSSKSTSTEMYNNKDEEKSQYSLNHIYKVKSIKSEIL